MIKKYLTIIFSILLIFSIGINIYQYFNFRKTILTERDRLTHSSLMLNIFGFPYESFAVINQEIQEQSLSFPDSTYIKVLDTTLLAISTLKDELATISGGYKIDTGYPINLNKVVYTNKYFYSENKIRSYAINDFKKVIESYMKACNTECKNSTLSKRIKLYNDFLDEGILTYDFFVDMSVGEAFNLLNEIELILSLEQSKFLINCNKNKSH